MNLEKLDIAFLRGSGEMATNTQQQILKDIIKTNIAPAMKKAGFKRKGNWFVRRGRVYDKYLNVMSSRWNTAEEASFTLDIYVMNKDGVPTKDIEVANKRIGHLKTGRDYWYTLTPKANAEKLGQEIENDISEYALPFFDKYEGGK